MEAEIIARRDDRREQGAKVIAERNKAKSEEGSEPMTAPQSQPASSSSNGQQERQAEANNAKRKPDDTEEQGETRSKKQNMACLSGRAIEESVKSVLEQLIEEDDKSIRALCTHEVVGGIIDSLNEMCTRKEGQWICVRFHHGRCEQQEVGPFRPKDSERSRGEIERGSSVVTCSVTPSDSVRHDAVAELRKAER